MDQKKILLVNLSKGHVGEDVALILGALFISSISSASFQPRWYTGRKTEFLSWCTWIVPQFHHAFTGQYVFRIAKVQSWFDTCASNMHQLWRGYTTRYSVISERSFLPSRDRRCTTFNQGNVPGFRFRRFYKPAQSSYLFTLMIWRTPSQLSVLLPFNTRCSQAAFIFSLTMKTPITYYGGSNQCSLHTPTNTTHRIFVEPFVGGVPSFGRKNLHR